MERVRASRIDISKRCRRHRKHHSPRDAPRRDRHAEQLGYLKFKACKKDCCGQQQSFLHGFRCQAILFDASAIECGADALCGCMELLELVVRQMDFERTHDAIGADHARDRERDIVEAILAIEDRGAREDRVLIVEHGLDEAASCHRDARVREALAVDDVVSDLHELVFDGLVAEFSFSV